MATDPSRIFRPEALEARAERPRARVLPPMSAPALRWASAAVALVVVAALAIGLAWPVPKTQRVAIVGLPDGGGIVVLGRTDADDSLRPGATVVADFGSARPIELRITEVAGTRTPQQLGERFPESRVPAVANVTLSLALATPRDRAAVPPALNDASVLGTATTGRQRVIDLLLRDLT